MPNELSAMLGQVQPTLPESASPWIQLLLPLLGSTGLVMLIAQQWAKARERSYTDRDEYRKLQETRVNELEERLNRAEELHRICEERHNLHEAQSRLRERRIDDLERSNDELRRRVDQLSANPHHDRGGIK